LPSSLVLSYNPLDPKFVFDFYGYKATSLNFWPMVPWLVAWRRLGRIRHCPWPRVLSSMASRLRPLHPSHWPTVLASMAWPPMAPDHPWARPHRERFRVAVLPVMLWVSNRRQTNSQTQNVEPLDVCSALHPRTSVTIPPPPFATWVGLN